MIATANGSIIKIGTPVPRRDARRTLCSRLAGGGWEGLVLRCPKCGGSRVDQYMMTTGPMVCLDCGFRVEDKTAQPNPFVYEGDDDPAAPEPEGPRPGLGAQMAALYGSKGKK